MLEKKGIKKIGFRGQKGQKGSTGRGYAQSAQPIEEPVNRLWSSGRVLVEGGQKSSLSPSSFLFPVEVFPLPVKDRLRQR